jgi:sigma-E factor negative regulatory protein RseC
MITQPAKVISIEADHYVIETLPKSACPRCEEGRGCGGGILAQAFANKTYRLNLARQQHSGLLAEQQTLIIGIDSRGLLAASIVLYLLPLVLMLAGALTLGMPFDYHDLYTVAGAIAGFTVGAFVASKLSRRLIESELTKPFVVPDETDNCWYQAK